MNKKYSAKSYWIQVLSFTPVLIFLPKAVHYFFPRSSLVASYFVLLGISIVASEANILRSYSSSKLKEVIIVWILSSTVWTLSSMFGFFLFNEDSQLQLMVLFLFAEGLFFTLFYLLLIIRNYKKQRNKS